MRDEESRIENALQAPPHIANQIQDRAGMTRLLRTLKREREAQTAYPYAPHERDEAVRREAELRERWLNGMLTQAEMRRNPAGAVDKHRHWEARNKRVIGEWKNVIKRLHASPSGVPGRLRDENDVSNIERYRPVGGSGELNMHNEQIISADYHMPHTPHSVVMTPAEGEVLKTLDPETHDGMALFSPEQRQAVLEIVRQAIAGMAPPAAQPAPAPKARNWSPEKRQAAREKMAAIHERQRAARAAKAAEAEAAE